MMDIQTAVFQNQSMLWQHHTQPQTVSPRSQSQENESSVTSGHRSTEVMNRLTQKLAEQSENPDRVAAIKAKIANGTFQVDTGKIADQLIWGERIALLGNQ